MEEEEKKDTIGKEDLKNDGGSQNLKNDEDDEDEDGDQQFDHLIPSNWREIADMRMR